MIQKNSVLIVSPEPKAGTMLSGLLPASSFSPICTVPTAGEARRLLVDRRFDIAVINAPLPDDFGPQLAIEISEKQGCGVLLLVKAEVQEAVCLKVEDYGILTLPKPANRQMVFQSIKLIAATRQKIRTLEEKTSTLESKMEEIRLVNRAKLLLIEHLKMSEPEAHHYIEKRAMDTCVKRRTIAENIIKTYEP
ncbi:MAG: ANTAR domain-containing response regulator [Clostridia bacterium]